MKKLWCAILTCMLCCSVFLSSCAANSMGVSPQTADRDKSSGMQADRDKSSGMQADRDKSSGMQEGAESKNVADDADASEETEQRKIVKNADVTCEVTGAKKAYGEIAEWVKRNDGQEYSQRANQSGDYVTVEAVIKIDPSRLDDLLAYIEQQTSVTYLNTTTDDVTSDYVDTQLRLKSQKAALEQYYKMLENVNDLNEILQLRKIIDELTANIESMEGKLAFWDKQVSRSTVSITIYEKDNPDKPKEKISFQAMSFGKMLRYVGNGFFSVLNVLTGIFQWLLIVLLAASPVILVIVAIILIVLKRKKRSQEQKPK